MYVCVCACVCVRPDVCVSVCVCVSACLDQQFKTMTCITPQAENCLRLIYITDSCQGLCMFYKGLYEQLFQKSCPANFAGSKEITYLGAGMERWQNIVFHQVVMVRGTFKTGGLARLACLRNSCT